MKLNKSKISIVFALVLCMVISIAMPIMSSADESDLYANKRELDVENVVNPVQGMIDYIGDTGKEITIRELAGLIVNTVGYQGKLTFDSSKPDGTMRKLTDPSKLHNLGWHHKIDIEEGVQRMYEWYLG